MTQAALLFVYGTMLSNGCNHSRIAQAGGLLLGEFQTLDRFTMAVRDTVWSEKAPVVVRNRRGDPMLGELYALSWLAVIDRIDPFEGHPELYRREPVKLRGLSLPVEAYIFRQPISRQDPLVAPIDGVLSFRAVGVVDGQRSNDHRRDHRVERGNRRPMSAGRSGERAGAISDVQPG